MIKKIFIIILFLTNYVHADQTFWQPFQEKQLNNIGHWIQSDWSVINVKDNAFKNTQIYTLANQDGGVIICTVQFYLKDFNPAPNYTECFKEGN